MVQHINWFPQISEPSTNSTRKQPATPKGPCLGQVQGRDMGTHPQKTQTWTHTLHVKNTNG